MRPILLALLAAALPLAAHADTVTFSGPVGNFTDDVNYSAGGLSDSTGGYNLSILVPYGALSTYTATGGTLCAAFSDCNGYVTGISFPDANTVGNSGTELLSGTLTGGTLISGTTYEYTLSGVEGNGIPGTESYVANGPLTGTVDIDTSAGQFVSADLSYTFTPLPQTPEPSSLILLGTGVLSLAGAARRRLRRS